MSQEVIRCQQCMMPLDTLVHCGICGLGEPPVSYLPPLLVRHCPECGSGDVRWDVISVRPYCAECRYWAPTNFGSELEAVTQWNQMVDEANFAEFIATHTHEAQAAEKLDPYLAAADFDGEVYVHYKGGVYRKLFEQVIAMRFEADDDVTIMGKTFIVTDNMENCEAVAYEHLWPNPHGYYLRPKIMFHGKLPNGEDRFKLVSMNITKEYFNEFRKEWLLDVIE